MCHCSGCRNSEKLIRDRASGRGAASDIRCSCSVYCGVCALRSSRTEFTYRSSLRGTRYSRRLCRNKRLVIELHEYIRFDKLGLGRLCSHRDKRLSGINDRSLGNRPHISVKFELPQIIKKFLGEHLLPS